MGGGREEGVHSLEVRDKVLHLPLLIMCRVLLGAELAASPHGFT